MAEGFEQEANGLQEIFDRLFPNANAGVAHLQLPVDAVEEACKRETQDLYTSEGKADRVGDAGVPDSLRTWRAE